MIGVLGLVVQFGLLVCCVEIIYYLRRAVIGSEPFRDRRLALAEAQLDVELLEEVELRKIRQAADNGGGRAAFAK